jgi:hypothetical protein
MGCDNMLKAAAEKVSLKTHYFNGEVFEQNPEDLKYVPNPYNVHFLRKQEVEVSYNYIC